MNFILKRLTLGLFLIAVTACLLLLSDLRSRKSAKAQKLRDEAIQTSQTTEKTPHRKKWKVAILALNNVRAIEESQAGVLAGLKESKLVEGQDYEIQIRNAQGDAPTLNAMVDASLNEQTDLFIAISTLALQATLKKIQATPIVFTQVTDPIKAGAGKTFTDHLTNVTGSTPVSDHEKMIKVLRQLLPQANRIGTLFNPSEDNSLIQRDGLAEAARHFGLELVSMAVNQSTDIPDASVALSRAQLDAICQISDNLTSAGFVSIARTAEKAKMPLFAYQTAQAEQGAAVAVARDFSEAGRVAGLIAARIIQGENPGVIPFQAVTQTRLVFNKKAAQEQGLALPQSMLQQADKVISESGK